MLSASGHISLTVSNFNRATELYWYPCSNELIFDESAVSRFGTDQRDHPHREPKGIEMIDS
jgi:hypothetical protein